jgi:hypothetical protein
MFYSSSDKSFGFKRSIDAQIETFENREIRRNSHSILSVSRFSNVSRWASSEMLKVKRLI